MKIKNIIKNVSAEFGVDITTRSRKREYVYARAVYYKLSREVYNKTFSEIGRAVGVDHATVLHSVTNVFPVIERFEPDVHGAYVKLKSKLSFEADHIKSASFDLRGAKEKIAELQYKLNESEKIAQRNAKLGAFEDLLSRVPDDKVDILRVRLDAIIKML